MNDMRTVQPHLSEQLVLASSQDWSATIDVDDITDPLPPIVLRRVSPKDIDFLFAIYMQTRLNSVDDTTIDEAEQKSILWCEFLTQHQELRERYPTADFHMIVLDGKSAGQFFIDRSRREMNILDFSLLAKYLEPDVCTYLIRDLLTEATLAQKHVKASIHCTNEIVHYYQNLGFTLTGSVNGRYLMHWSPKF